MLAIPSKPFTYTAKGTARRQAIITDYEPEIADMYERYERNASGSGMSAGISPPTSLGEEDIVCFIRSLVQTALGREISDTVDVFQYGCDRSVASSHSRGRH